MKEFKKKIDKLIKLINSEKNTETLFFGKVISLTYLTTAIEPIFQNSKNKTPSKNLLNIVDKTKNIFNSFIYLSNFTNKKSFIKSFENLNFYKSHQKLWQKIWPEHSYKEYDNLVEYRGKRLDYNNIKKQFLNKEVIDFGCGNGSISIALLKRGAKNCHGIDFGKENIVAAKKWAKYYNFSKKTKFEKKDILKFKTNKKYDFIVCSAVLHHLKNRNELNKALKIISKTCKEGSYFYFFIRGHGGARYYIQDACLKCFKNIDPVSIRRVLETLNFSREKITHLVDWFKAIYMQTKPNDILNTLKRLNFTNFKRLKGPHKNDLDINQINSHKKSKFKFGTGELRYVCQYKPK